MDRRTYLGGIAAAGVGSVAGCTSADPLSGSDDTVLDPPEQTRGDPSHPVHGDQLPSFSLQDPLANETITDDQFRGEQAILMTFFYTNCPDGLCPFLLGRMRNVQLAAEERGFGDEGAFLAVTFDPERDTAEALQAEADAHEVDLDSTWHFLRPEDNEAAHELVAEDYGVPITDPAEHDHGEHGGNETGDEEGITHYGIFILANEEGIVERAYFEQVGWARETIIEDLETVVTA